MFNLVDQNATLQKDNPGAGIGYTIPATNYTDWTPYVLRDTQKQSKGLWVREKVTVYPPINAKRKLL